MKIEGNFIVAGVYKTLHASLRTGSDKIKYSENYVEEVANIIKNLKRK